MNDKGKILRHLQEVGPITPLEALELYGCYRLGARIFDLRHDGHCINTELVEGKDRFGQPMRYARYSLEKKEDRPDGDASEAVE